MATNYNISDPLAYRDNKHNESIETQDGTDLDTSNQYEDEEDIQHTQAEEGPDLLQAQTTEGGPDHLLTQAAPAKIEIEDIKNVIDKHLNVIMNDPMAEVTGRMEGLKLTQKPITYLQNEEQISKLQTLEIAENQVKAEVAEQLQKVLQLVLGKDEKATHDYIQELETQKQKHTEQTQALKTGVSEAQKLANKYKTVLSQPSIKKPPQGTPLNPQRTSPREIISVTGKFDPFDDKTDFNQIWNKLTAYGQLNYFEEGDYKTALAYILQNEAYDALIAMTDEDQPLQYIIDYFAKVYGRKRSLTQDRQAVDNFARKKNELLEICMYRSLISIDRLKHLYTKEAWPEIRSTLRRNILTQVISEKTRRHIQIEENEIIEKTGLHIDTDKLIEMAQRYEILHNEVPTKEVTTVFKTASGGFTEDISSMKQELQHLKKTKQKDKQYMTEMVQEILTNPTRIYKNDGKPQEQRERRRSNSQSEQRQARQNSFDRSRNINPKQNGPTHITYNPPQNPTLPPSIQRRRDEQRQPTRERQDRNRSISPYNPPKPTTPQSQPRDTSRQERRNTYNRPYNRSYSRDRSTPYQRNYSRDRRTGRSNERNRSREGWRNRSNSGTRSPRNASREPRYRTDSIRRYRDRSNSQRRNPSTDYHNPNQHTPTYNKSVLLNINRAETENYDTTQE